VKEVNIDKVFTALNALRAQQPSGLLSVIATYVECFGVYTVSLKHRFGMESPSVAFEVGTRGEAMACVKFARKEAG